MNLLRKLFFTTLYLFLTCLPLNSMDQKPVEPTSFQTKIYIFPFAFVGSKIQIFGGSNNSNLWKPFETQILNKKNTLYSDFIKNLKYEVARTLHYQTLGLFAHNTIRLKNALDTEKGIQYFLNEFENEEIYYINASLKTAIFFVEVPYITNARFNFQQQKFLERLEKAEKQKNDFPEFFKKDNFQWINLDEIYQNHYTLRLKKAIQDNLFQNIIIKSLKKEILPTPTISISSTN